MIAAVSGVEDIRVQPVKNIIKFRKDNRRTLPDHLPVRRSKADKLQTSVNVEILITHYLLHLGNLPQLPPDGGTSPCL